MNVSKTKKAVTVISDDRNEAVLEMTAKFVKVIIKPISKDDSYRHLQE